VTGPDIIGIGAALCFTAAFACRSLKRLRVWAAVGSGLLLVASLWDGVWSLSVLAVVVLGLNLTRLANRRPTRPLSQMDHDVHERIRKISAESRYSSAGIEF
jgi:hypothetical protein